MPFFRPKRRRKESEGAPGHLSTHTIRKVKRHVVESILASGSSTYPNEFGAALRSEEVETITDILLIPGTTAGKRHANFQLYMLPVDLTVVGTVHSHPSGALHPSEADLTLFRAWGRIHIIVGAPFREYNWRAYTNLGEEVTLSVVD
jgi:proteasome lid subunit RPN8/RPN11